MKIPFAPDYDVTELGIVTNIRGRLLTPYKHHSGYIMINLWIAGKKKTATMHLIMAETFIPKPSSTAPLTVNHKNKDKTDYSLSNLEWLTNADNITHGQGKKVEQVLNGCVVAVHASSQEAARNIGKPNAGSAIRAVCRNEPGRLTYNNYKWRYEK